MYLLFVRCLVVYSTVRIKYAFDYRRYTSSICAVLLVRATHDFKSSLAILKLLTEERHFILDEGNIFYSFQCIVMVSVEA